MKYKIVNRPLSKEDLQKALKYYKDISPNLAKEFLYRIREGRKYIALNPEADDIMYNNIRMHFIKQFPYHIHYFVDHNKQQIVIIAIEFSKRYDLNFSKRK